MTRTRFLGILVVVMVGLNLITISLLFLSKTDHRPHHRPAEIKKVISERLHFSDSQNEAYEVLITEHRKSIRQMDDEMIVARNSFYAQLIDEHASADSQLVAIGQIQQKIESIHFNHFIEIRKLCTAEQIPAFNELTFDLAAYFAGPKPPKREH